MPKFKNVIKLSDHRQPAPPAGFLTFVEVRNGRGQFQGIEPKWLPVSPELRARLRRMGMGGGQ